MATATLKPTSLAELKKRREIVAPAPSGVVFKIRPLNMENYALSGGLPTELRDLALKEGDDGVSAVDELFKDAEKLDERGREVKNLISNLVRQVVVEPNLDAIGELDDVLLPVDMKWLFNIALGNEDEDGQGRRLWGREPLNRWDTFRHFHGCDEDCTGCERVLDAFSALVRE